MQGRGFSELCPCAVSPLLAVDSMHTKKGTLSCFIRERVPFYIVFQALQGDLVVNFLALLDDQTVSQLVCGEAGGGSSHLFTVHQNTSLGN